MWGMQENGNIIIGGHASAYGVNNTQMHKISPNGAFVSYKEFDFYATYNSFSFQHEDTFLAAGLNSDNFLFISRHKLSSLSVPDHINTDFSIELYPNPATINFKIDTNQIIKSVKIYNTLGRLERTFLPSESYNISDLNSGIYFIQVEGMERNSTKKLIKH